MLLIPGIRFGRQYHDLAFDLLHGHTHGWNQLALYEDSKAASAILHRASQPGDTLLVWGYRPEVLMLTRMPLGDGVLDSQPLNGVFADRHLVSSKRSVAPRLGGIHSTWIVDGLGLLNPALAFRDAAYEEFARTKQSIVYRRRIQ